MKKTNSVDYRVPYPKRARALLTLFCQTEKLENLPGFSLTPSQVECRFKLDGQNNRLAREVALYVLSGGPNALPKRGDGASNAYDELVCERFALGFTRDPFN